MNGYSNDFLEVKKLLNLAGLLIEEEGTLRLTDKFFVLLIKHGIADIHRQVSSPTYAKEIIMKAVIEALETKRSPALTIDCFNLMKSMMILSLKQKPDDSNAQVFLQLLEAE